MSGDYLTGNSRCPICSGHHPINAPCFLSTNWIPLEKTPMTTDIKELVKRLRTFKHRDANAAADALEAMAGEVEAYESARVTWAESMRAWINRATVAERERDRLKAALEWALGEGDEWPERKPGEGAFYWRAELRRKALGGDAS